MLNHVIDSCCLKLEIEFMLYYANDIIRDHPKVIVVTRFFSQRSFL